MALVTPRLGGPVVARYAGRAGDGFICTSGKGMALYIEGLIPAVKEGAKTASASTTISIA